MVLWTLTENGRGPLGGSTLLTNEDINPIEASNGDTKISAAKITC